MSGLQKRRQQQPVPTDGGFLERPLIESDDIIIDILSRLPVKYLIQLRCVCKSWRALISDLHLVRKHLRRAVTGVNRNSYRLLISDSPFQSIDYEALKDVSVCVQSSFLCLQLPVTLERMSVVGSCNGLICLKGNKGEVLLWNPCTRVTKMLPGIACFYFCPKFYGFGYDSTIEDYKVILGGESTTADGMMIAVFTLKSGLWRTKQYLDSFKLHGQGCLVNGALHWVELKWSGEELRPVLSSRIISFILAEENIVPLPYLHIQSYISIRIGTIANRLFAYLFNDVSLSDIAITVWVMKDYGVHESWTKIIQIPLKSLRQISMNFVNIICILENDEVLMSCDSSYLALYNPKENTLTKVLKTPTNLLTEATMYVETLVSPVIGGGANI